MPEGGIVKADSYKQLKQVEMVNVEGEDSEGVPIFPRMLVADINTGSEFWVHLGFNDERNHTGVSYGKLIKAGDAVTIQALFSMRKFWLSYGNPELENVVTAVNQTYSKWRPHVLRIWMSPLTKSEAAIQNVSKETLRKRRIFWVVTDTQSGGGGSSECCYWS